MSARPHAVASEAELRVHVALYADHHGKGLIVLASVREDGVLDEPRGVRLGGKGEVGRERNHAVLGVDALRPVGEKAADFIEGAA